MQTQKELIEEIDKLLSQLDPEDIYRSVYDTHGNCLHKGTMPVRQTFIENFERVNFRNKTVIDLGCNFGIFSFLAARLGASHVTGVDQLNEAVHGCRLLAKLYGLTNVSFKRFDMEEQKNDLGKFDMVVLIDFFGKSNIRKKKIPSFLRLSKDLSSKYLLTSFRPINRIEKDLRMTEDEFNKLYPSTYIKQKNFYLIDYVKDILSDNWKMTTVSNYSGKFSKDKLLFLFERKTN